MSLTRRIPDPVKRTLRQEVCFGCPVCGNPILEYHHIIPWAELNHHNPEHMVALCPTHHTEYGKLSRDISYELKLNPINKRNGRLHGLLGTNKLQQTFLLGGNRFINTPTILEFYGVPIIRYKIFENQSVFNLWLPDSNWWPEVEVRENNLLVNHKNSWDINFRTNFVQFRKKQGENFLTIDLRGDDAVFTGCITLGGQTYELSNETFDMGRTSMTDLTIEGCRAGISVGSDRERLIPPNYAMLTPMAHFQRV
ncbi:MAG: HNH endonuclease signature motif containing protein [Pseudomonadota bacterium]